MNRLLKYFLIVLATVLSFVAALLIFVQSDFAKDKIRRALEEIALQEGIAFKIGSVEGEIPLKWTLKNLHLQIPSGDTIDIDLVRLRLSLLPLLRGEIGISYISAHAVTYQYQTSKAPATTPISLPPFFIRSLKIEQLHLINHATGHEGLYSFSGSCQFKTDLKTLDLHAKVRSSDLEGELFVQGSRKSDRLFAHLSLEAKTDQALLPFFTLPDLVPFKLEATGSGAFSTPFQGEITLHLPTYQNSLITSHFSFASDHSFKLNSLLLKSATLTAAGNAAFDPQFHPTLLDFSFQVSDLSTWIPNLPGAAQGNIHFTPSQCHLTLLSNQLSLFSNVALDIRAQSEQDVWLGSLSLSASHPELGFQGTSQFQCDYPHFKLQSLALEGPQIFLSGDLTANLSNFSSLQGGLAFQLKNLTPFSDITQLSLSGSIGGTLDFQGENLRSHLVGKHLKIGNFLAQETQIDLLATDFENLKGNLSIDLHHAYLADIFFQSASYSMGWNHNDWSYQLSASGDWKHPFTLSSAGSVAFAPHTFHLSCQTLTGHLLQKNLFLEEPFQFTLENDNLLLTNLKIKISEGFFNSALQITPEAARIYLKAEHFPLDFLALFSSRFSLQGLAAVDIDLAGNSSDLVGHANLLLEHAEILPAGSSNPIQTKASLQTNLSHSALQFHSHVVASQEQFVDLSLTLPLSYRLSPFHLSIDPTKNLAGNLTVEGYVEQLLDFINLGSQRLGGLLSCRLLLSGTWDHPSLFGPLLVQGGFYQNDFIGLTLKQGLIAGEASGQQISISSLHVTDGDSGTCTATAHFDLQPQLPFALQGTLDHFQVIEFDWLAGRCSGPFQISGNLEKGLISGNFAVDQASITIPDKLPSEIPTLPVTFINQPPSFTPPLPQASYPFHYDLHIHAEHGTHLSGRGLDAELAGDLHLAGKNLDIIPTGTLHTLKGIFSFVGNDFKITTGEVLFSENGNFLNIAANLELSDLLVTLLLRGTLQNPQLTFQSTPPLPTSTLLARILFNKDVSELSASQIVQLATTLMTLSSSSTPDLLGTLRRNLGIDRLSISANEKGDYSVEIGKSISTEVVKGVAATLSQDTDQSHVKVEVELKGGFILGAETQEDDQGKFSFKWNKNY